ncbi:NADH-ubiquinone oxidoreductase, chain 49kDa [Rhodoferax ferrireducens T118]|uniref:NADH-ubiquinone oxidoreductase, chain 49kDa n=1 Tax=Albidiferax ferrireducens (strain ATCC BAA-621 / DSM 15236 / T118) TaxID=338969 RepID=Q21TB4_ALBFT|nr:NADH-quinone oxidoreductase subunit C [Rhodoferax ferrireducens]ABD70989.1 NADH-ubiquinone oxidoreductase, chain 49kDa [Rhodoferax ferrireducens T118]
MTTAQALALFPLRDIAATSLQELMQLCGQRLQAGERLLTLFGRPAPELGVNIIVVTAVLQPAQGALVILRATAQRGEHYRCLTAQHPAAQIFERELWEQTGLFPDDHPWLKPVRFEGERQQRMLEYPFFKVRGQEVHEVGVGPIHASVIEPGHFRFMCLGENVHHLEIQLGYQHRGVEGLLLRRPVWQLTPLVESICGDSAVAYAWGYGAALELMSNQPVAPAIQASRAIALEMERIAMHLATLGGMATDIAFLQGGATYGRLRTAIINASQRVCGNRFGRGWIRPGQAKPLSEALQQDLTRTLRAFAPDFTQINQLMLAARSVQARLHGTGTVSQQAALDLGLTGPVARASGVALDHRTQWPGAAYGHAPLPMVTEPDGDCWARMRLRMREVDASLAWLLQLLGDTTLNLSQAGQAQSSTPAALQAEALCVSLVEGTRGPVLQVLETSAKGELRHYKVQDPSTANWFGLAFAMRDNAISDFPICNKSFDLSYCGNDL